MAPHPAARGKQERRSFLKKRTKKLLVLSPEDGAPPRPYSKSFLLLFFKKEALSSCLFPR
jgi:hypothetical protein